MTASGDNAQADEAATVNGYDVAHSGIGHVYAVEAHCGHDK